MFVERHTEVHFVFEVSSSYSPRRIGAPVNAGAPVLAIRLIRNGGTPESTAAPETLLTMYNLSCALNKTGSYSEAESLGRKTLEARSRVLGPENRATLKSMVSLGISLLKEALYPEAEKLLREALAIQRRTLGPNHPDVAASLYQLAILNEQVKRKDEAIALLHDSLNHGLPADVRNGIAADPDLNYLHDDPRFNTLVTEIGDRDPKAGQKLTKYCNRMCDWRCTPEKLAIF